MLSALFQTALMNALIAAAISPLAFAAARALRRPPVTRALWLLVLLKLVTPPLWTFPLWTDGVVRPPPLPPAVAAIAPAPVEVNAGSSPVELRSDPTALTATIDERPDVTAPPTAAAPVLAAKQTPSPRPATGIFLRLARHWRTIAANVWLTGSALYLLLVLRATLRLRRIVRRSAAVDADLSRRAARLAARLGLRRLPQLRFVAAPLPPMLCAIGMSPRLLLPTELWEQLDTPEQDSVLAHELAHLRRGDHRVRVFELCVTCLFWWLPILWWARRELREATEQCCDAWVLSEMPRSARSYAAAILQAIEYMSTAPAAEPALASGMGQFTDLKRRLVMIQRGTVRRALSWPAFAGVCGAAAILLPLAPGFGQSVSVGPPSTPAAGTSAAQPGQSTGSATAGTAVGGGVPIAETAAPAAPAGATGLPTAETAAPAAPAGGSGLPTAESAAATPPATAEDRSLDSLPGKPGQHDQLAQARRTVERLRRELDRAEARLALLEKAQDNTVYTPYAPPGHNGNTSSALSEPRRAKDSGTEQRLTPSSENSGEW